MALVRIAIGLILSLSLLGSVFPATHATASPDEVMWSRVNIPTEGMAGDWVLASGADIHHLTMAIDGTLYCYANPTGTSSTLFKSTDGGCSWSYTGKVTDNITDIAVAPDDADTVYYATSSAVYRSTDAGSSFSTVTVNPGGAGSNNVEITAIDVTRADRGHLIAIGTRDKDNWQYGSIYILDESESFTVIDSNPGSYDVYAVAFSPDFIHDRQLVAVVTDETDAIVTARIGNNGWGADIGNATISGLIPISATIAFPDDYNPDVTVDNYIQFVAISTGSENGDVYKIKGDAAPANSTVTDLNIGSIYGLNSVDVTGLAVTGDAETASLLAGAAGDAQVYLGSDGGRNWKRTVKPPTGGAVTGLLMAPDYSDSGLVYVATSDNESAFSISRDSGVTWNQIGLIDTAISDIVDLAVSPNYSHDNTLFMLTFGSKHSLWRSLNEGKTWERLYSGALPHVDQINLVELSPRYGTSQVIFIAGTSAGTPVIWKSSDNGQRFLRLSARDPTTGASFAIDTWTVVNDNTLFVGSFDSSNGVVYRTDNGGLFYSTRALAGSQSLNDIALSPDYDEDRNILAGNTDGWVYWSDDDGSSFEPLPYDATSSPLTGSITVAFDPDYSRNKTVYAASTTQDKGIYRFIIDRSTEWESVDATLPDGAMLSQLVTSADGVLYAVNFQEVDTTKKQGGIERCLNPTYSLGPTFETVTRGLADEATLIGLRIHGDRLWSVDSTNDRLLTYIDSLTSPVIPTSPLDKAPGIYITDVQLKWEASKGATSYEWQLDYDTDFSSVPSGFTGDTRATSARLPELEQATTYYWRVRAAGPVSSPWSDKWSFNTSLGSEIVAPRLIRPKAAERELPIRPVFQWGAIAGANGYELLVSADASFTSPLIVKIGDYHLSSTAWQCDINLDYGTTYYWKVRAASSDTYSAWSAAGAFTSESPPEPPGLALPPAPATPPISEPPPPASAPSTSPSPSAPSASSPSPSLSPPSESPQPPPPSSQQNAPYWATWLMYLGGAFLLILLAMLITMIILTVRVLRF